MGVWRDEPIIFTTGQSNTEKMRINSNGKSVLEILILVVN